MAKTPLVRFKILWYNQLCWFKEDAFILKYVHSCHLHNRVRVSLLLSLVIYPETHFDTYCWCISWKLEVEIRTVYLIFPPWQGGREKKNQIKPVFCFVFAVSCQGIGLRFNKPFHPRAVTSDQHSCPENSAINKQQKTIKKKSVPREFEPSFCVACFQYDTVLVHMSRTVSIRFWCS